MSTHSSATSPEPPQHHRMLWIDGVGGYLLIAGRQWTLGGPGASDDTDVVIQGELSRRACQIVFREDQYVLQTFSPASVVGPGVATEPNIAADAENAADAEITLGPAIHGSANDDTGWLRDGDAIRLGSSVELKFRRPHPLSTSGRLDVSSGHRTRPQCDAIILLVDTCVLGPTRRTHIHCPHWEQDVILYVKEDKWHVRSKMPFTVNGKNVDQGVCLDEQSNNFQIKGDTFAMTLEPVTVRARPG